MNINTFYRKHETEILNDLQNLIAIKTYDGVAPKTEISPLGNNIDQAFAYLTKIATNKGLKVTNYQNYALAIEINHQQPEIYFAFLNHVDTVRIYARENWLSPPFSLTKKDNNLYARGVNDNKGPLIYILYLLVYLQNHSKVDARIRLIIGGAEETSWEGIKYYQNQCYQLTPKYIVSPDGNFPVINREKGIIEFAYEVEIADPILESIISTTNKGNNCYRAIYNYFNHEQTELTGIKSKSRNPQNGVNIIDVIPDEAVFKSPVFKFLVENFQTKNGDIFGLDDIVNEELKATFNVWQINYHNQKLIVNFDYRFIYDYDEEYLTYKFRKILKKGNLKLTRLLPFHYLPETSLLASRLKSSYEKVTGEPLSFHTKGAASYARAFNNSVCAGPVFSDEISKSHEPNETMNISNMIKACEIYYELIKSLLS